MTPRAGAASRPRARRLESRRPWCQKPARQETPASSGGRTQARRASAAGSKRASPDRGERRGPGWRSRPPFAPPPQSRPRLPGLQVRLHRRLALARFATRARGRAQRSGSAESDSASRPPGCGQRRCSRLLPFFPANLSPSTRAPTSQPLDDAEEEEIRNLQESSVESEPRRRPQSPRKPLRSRTMRPSQRSGARRPKKSLSLSRSRRDVEKPLTAPRNLSPNASLYRTPRSRR